MRLPSSWWARFCLLFLLGLLLFLGFTVWRRSVAQAPPLQPLPQDPLIQVYFNHSEAASYREPYRDQTRLGDDLEAVIVETIQAAQTSVDVAVQELRLPHIAAALRDRQQSGVRVRVILENNYSQPLSSMASQNSEAMEERDRQRYEDAILLIDRNRDGQLSPTEIAQNDALVLLQTAQIPVIDDRADGSKGSGLMHDKFVVVDGRRVLVSSANFTPSDVHGDFLASETRGNANHLLKIESAAVAEIFTREFNQMWGDGPAGSPDSLFGLKKPYHPAQSVALGVGSTVTVQFSPTSTRLPWEQSANGLIGRSLNTATRTADLALFVFSEQPLSNLLETRHQQGVQVRSLIEPGFAYRNYSEGLDMMGVALPDSRCRVEKENHLWSGAIATVGIPTLPEGDMLHHKFAVVDGYTVITGSQNWSAAANHTNDETVIVIQNATVAAHFHREFERLYKTASLGIPTWLQTKIQQEKQRCRL